VPGLPPDSPSPTVPQLASAGSASFARLASAALIRWRVPLAVVAVVVCATAVDRSRHLRFSRSVDAMFDRSDPALVPYRRIARTFGSNEVVLAAYDDPQLFTAEGIARLRALTARLNDAQQTPGVASATSLATTLLGDRIVDLEGSLLARKLVALMEGYAVGADRRTAGIVCVLEPPAPAARTPREKAVSRADTIDRLRAMMAQLPSGMVAGEPSPARCFCSPSAACAGSSFHWQWYSWLCGRPEERSPSSGSS